MPEAPGSFDEETKLAAAELAADSLSGQTDAVRKRQVPWDGYASSNLVEKAEAAMIQAYDSADAKRKSQLWSESGREYASLFLALLSKLNNDETIQYTLTLIDDALHADPARVGLFHGVQGGKPYGVFLNLAMEKKDKYIQNKAVKILSALCVTGPPMDDSSAEKYLKWLAAQLRTNDTALVQVVIKSLMSVLRFDSYRLKFYNETDGVEGLNGLVDDKAANFQMQYQVIFCYWLLTFNADIAGDIPKKRIPAVIGGILSKTNKEKVVRVAVLTLRNIVDKSKPDQIKHNVENMVANKLLRHLRAIQQKSWKDEDIKEDVDATLETMMKHVHELSSFDEYAAEVRSGELKWSAVHKSDSFWRDNVMKLNENDHEILRLLIATVEKPQTTTTLAVALHDLGEYCRTYPQGRGNVEELGGKSAVMAAMAHADAAVRYEALIATQKMMVRGWHFLNKGQQPT